MKKLIANLLGVNIHATSKNVKGRKSSGVEDNSRNYQHWAERNKEEHYDDSF